MYNNFFNQMSRNNNNSSYNNHNNYKNNFSNNSNSNSKNNFSNSTNNSINNSNNSSNSNTDNTENRSSQNSGFMHNSRLSNIDPIKLKIIMEIREKSKNKSVEELLPEIIKINQELNRRNMNFTKNESEILMDVIEESLSPADRQKFNMLKGFMS